MKKLLLFAFLFYSISTIMFAQYAPGGDAPPISPGKHFIHISTTSNSTSNWTTIDNPNTNSNPTAKLFITHNYNASGSGVYNDHVSGLWYNSTSWTIFNEDGTPIIENSAYHILVADENQSTVFQHTARPSNINSNWTALTHPQLDGNPNARILVTQILIDTAANTYNNREIGVFYNGANKWAIFNENMDAMPNGASFNILILNNDNSILHTAVSGNIQGSTTKIDLPALNNNPNAIIYVTQTWNGGGAPGVFNTQKVSTYYNGTQWTIYNEDNSTNMVENSKYNVYFGASSFVHKADATNSYPNLTYFDNPLINRDANAFIFALHNWNPFGAGTSVYNKKLGVFYTGSVWSIFDQDATPVSEGVYFNVAIAPKTDSAFLHTTTASNIISNYTTIDNPLLNGNPNVKILVQHRYVSSYNNKNVGVWYNTGGSKWTIFNQDYSAMEAGKDFNVWLLNDNKSFVHIVDSSNNIGSPSYSYLDNPLTNNNPNADIFITSLLDNSSLYNDHVVGVWYDDAAQKWVLYNEDLTQHIIGAKYNVYVINSLGTPTSVDDENNPVAVINFDLQQNYPNPFNPTTQIRFALAEQSQVTLKVYNILGKEITTLVNDVKGSGVHEVSFNGAGLASGVYFYKLQTGKFTQTRKMILIK
jgi:hypothetical protein